MRIGVYSPLSIGNVGFLVDGFKRRGWDVVLLEDRNAYKKGQTVDLDMCLTDGLRFPMNVMRDDYESLGVPVMVTDMGYVRRDLGYMQVGLNKLNWLPDFECPQDRWDRLSVDLQSRQSGDYVLITGQKPFDGSHSMSDKELVSMYQSWIDGIKQFTEREIVFRPHPRSPNMQVSGCRIDKPTDSQAGGLADVIQGAHCVVTYNSTSATDSIINGTPVITISDTAQAYDIAEHDLIHVDCPFWKDDSQPHFNRVAYSQWRHDEVDQCIDFFLEAVC